MDFVNQIERQFKLQIEFLRNSHRTLIFSHFDELGMEDTMNEYDWNDKVAQLMEGSMGEASENDCKKEVQRTFVDYLLDEDKEKFNSSWAVEYGKSFLEKEFNL